MTDQPTSKPIINLPVYVGCYISEIDGMEAISSYTFSFIPATCEERIAKLKEELPSVKFTRVAVFNMTEQGTWKVFNE